MRFVTIIDRKGHDYFGTSIYPFLFNRFLCYCKFSREFNFRETLHMRSFVKIKPSQIGDITLSFTDIGTFVKHALFAIFYVANVSLNAIRENKILAKISEFTVSIL